MSNSRKIHIGLGMALVAAFALPAGLVSADTSLPPGTKISCTMSGETETGRRWGYLEIGDGGKCYRYADPDREGEAAPEDVEHCKGLGFRLGCRRVYDRQPE